MEHRGGEPANRQAEFAVQFERGEAGLRALAPGAAVIVIVDVLSFATAVDVAMSRRATILPYRYADGTAHAFAQRHDALLAVPRRERNADCPYSLSPSTLAGLPEGSRLVLPSPNGATLLMMAAEAAPTARIIVGSLRNASAVAAHASRYLAEASVVVISAGERWADGSLRPALEDDLGAGAIIDALDSSNISPESRCMVACFRQLGQHLAAEIRFCTSGRELADAGYADDIEAAAALNVSQAVPVLSENGELFDALRRRA